MRMIWMLLATAGIGMAASMTQAYSFSTIGIAGTAPGVGCTTFGPTTVMRGSQLNLGVAQGGTGCGQLEDLKNNLGTVNLVTANTNVAGSFVGVNGAFSGSGSAKAKAQEDLLGVDAQFSLFGTSDSQTTRGAEALAVFSETLSSLSGTVNGGKIRYEIGLNGSQEITATTPGVTPAGEAFVYLAWRNLAQSFFYPVYFGRVGAPGITYAQVFGQYQYVTGEGITVGTSSVSVNRNFVFEVPYDGNPAFEGAFYLYAGAYANANSDIDILFGGTMEVLSVQAFDGQGRPIEILRGSDAAAVPEPAMAWLVGGLILGLARMKMSGRGERGDTAVREGAGR
jgi:hypothetical protein